MPRRLDSSALGALADLERRVVAADGGRLKLEWEVLRSRSGEHVEDLLWWEEGVLRGFAGLYAFGPPDVEIAGMVDPPARRQGIGSTLLDAALPLCAERGYARALVVTPRTTGAGAAFASARGAELAHSEHALVLHRPVLGGPTDPRLSLRPATVGDVPAVMRLLAAGFGRPPREIAPDDLARTLVGERDGSLVATLRLSMSPGEAAVHGFVVDPPLQGRGLGRDLLRRACRQAYDAGASSVHLEVAVDNERALGLYTSLGFVSVTTEDYYACDVTAYGATSRCRR